jgi:hypothetical protein
MGIAGSSNLYAFAGNDPINGEDPSGLFGGWDVIKGVGAIFGGETVNNALTVIDFGRSFYGSIRKGHGSHVASVPGVGLANAGSAGEFTTDAKEAGLFDGLSLRGLIRDLIVSYAMWSGQEPKPPKPPSSPPTQSVPRSAPPPSPPPRDPPEDPFSWHLPQWSIPSIPSLPLLPPPPPLLFPIPL